MIYTYKDIEYLQQLKLANDLFPAMKAEGQYANICRGHRVLDFYDELLFTSTDPVDIIDETCDQYYIDKKDRMFYAVVTEITRLIHTEPRYIENDDIRRLGCRGIQGLCDMLTRFYPDFDDETPITIVHVSVLPH